MDVRRGIGWAAIAIGLVLFGFMLGSRGDERRWQAYGPPGFAQQAPQGYQQAPGPQGYQQAPGPQGWERPGHGPHGHRGFGPGAFFFGPLFFLGGLLKLALLGFLLFAALRFFSGRRPWDGPPWSHGTGERSGEPRDDRRTEGERKGPDEPTSYTGGTTKL
jgi:predicted lipid-binding transport protein (Tim44 family)